MGTLSYSSEHAILLASMHQKMRDLPMERLTPSLPFMCVGVDYCRPFFIHCRKREKIPTKCYTVKSKQVEKGFVQYWIKDSCNSKDPILAGRWEESLKFIKSSITNSNYLIVCIIYICPLYCASIALEQYMSLKLFSNNTHCLYIKILFRTAIHTIATNTYWILLLLFF